MVARQSSVVEREPTLTVISNGLGQDSTAIIYMLGHDEAFRRRIAPRDVLVLHSDTGDEYPEVYAHRDALRAWCERRGLPFVSLPPDSRWHTPSNRGGIVEKSRRYGTVPSVSMPRSCTPSFKISPIYAFLADHLRATYGVGGSSRPSTFARFASRYGKLRMVLGFTREEAARVERSREGASDEAWMRACVTKSFPLYDLGMTRASCQAYIRGLGYEVPFASACATCFFQGDLRLAFLDRFYPARASDWCAREEAKLAKFAALGAQNRGVFRRGTVREALARARAAHSRLTDRELREAVRLAGHGVSSSY